MLGHRGLRQRQFVHDVAAHAGFLACEHPENPYADGVADRLGERGKLLVSGGALKRGRRNLARLNVFRWAAGIGGSGF
jgi:hypothetical protein